MVPAGPRRRAPGHRARGGFPRLRRRDDRQRCGADGRWRTQRRQPCNGRRADARAGIGDGACRLEPQRHRGTEVSQRKGNAREARKILIEVKARRDDRTYSFSLCISVPLCLSGSESRNCDSRMPADRDILLSIREGLEDLRPAEQRVARVVFADPAFATRASNGELAQRAGVSEPTVTRFCRAIGCEGVRDFKLTLAQSLAEGTPYIHSLISAADETGVVVNKVIDGLAEALRHTKRQIDTEALGRAIGALATTRRLVIFGVGAGSGIVAQDAELRFFRLDMTANA